MKFRINFTFANILIGLASYHVYKSRTINSNINYVCVKKKSEEIIAMSKQKRGVKVGEQDLHNYKVYWNIILPIDYFDMKYFLQFIIKIERKIIEQRLKVYVDVSHCT